MSWLWCFIMEGYKLKAMEKVDYKILSKKCCNMCGKFLKLNLVNKALHANLCWKCYKFKKVHNGNSGKNNNITVKG